MQENPAVDYVILQEGEERLLQLLKSFRRKELLAQIDGIAACDDGGNVVVRPPLKYMDLDTLPIPTDMVILKGMVFLGFSRGCYGGCRFCQEKNRMRFQSPLKAAEEVQYWYDRGCRHFYIGNANSIAGGKRLGDLVREIESRNLPVRLTLVGRPNDVVRHRAVLEEIFQRRVIHLDAVEVGIEANTQHMLDLLGRGTTPELNKNAMETLLALKSEYSPDTRIHANMILFSHFDMSLVDFVENVRFIGDYECSRTVLSLQVYGLPGTPLWQDMMNKGFKPNQQFGLAIADYPFSDKDVDRLFRKLVYDARMAIARQKLDYDFDDDIAFRYQCHDKLMEFYRSGDILDSVREYINSPADAG